MTDLPLARSVGTKSALRIASSSAPSALLHGFA